jgi:hypothetical protein
MNSPEVRRGISAVMLATQAIDARVLDLAAVLQGLTAQDFEIIVVGEAQPALADICASAPGLPLRVIPGTSVRAGFAAAAYDLICECAPDGHFDISELNHLLDAIEHGADLAVGYRPRVTDALVRQLQRWGWQIELDRAFTLFRSAISRQVPRARQLGYRVVELPVSHRRPIVSATTAAASLRS